MTPNKKKQVTFGETYSKNVQVHFPTKSGTVQLQTKNVSPASLEHANTVHITYSLGAEGHYVR